MKMHKLSLLILLIITISCSSNKDDHKLDNNLINASWVGDVLEQPAFDSLFYNDDPSPLFRKEFVTEDGIESATLYITAAGYYKASVMSHMN